jgi:ubiquinone/menaquinone biosynthesis C-methylase UbiE
LFADAVGKRGRVVGVDISAPMLAGARKRIDDSGLHNISLIQADAQVHRFEPGSFHLLASHFGVMFFADPVAAFNNLRSAARPRRAAVLCLLGTARGEQALADPL